MITALGEDLAFAMCIGCPVPKVASEAFCHMRKGAEAFGSGNLCLLREIERRQPGILNLTELRPYHNDEAAKQSLEARRQEILGSERKMNLQPLTKDEWLILEVEGEQKRPDLLERTRLHEEHPDEFDGPCECQLCMSYAD